MTGAILGGLTAALLLLGAGHVHGLLAWAVCAPLIVVCGGGVARAGGAGAVFGIAVTVGGHASWVGAAGERYFGLPPVLAIGAAGTLAVPCGALFGALLGVALHCAERWPVPWSILMVGAVWAAWEASILAVFPYYPWASLAATQADTPLLLQVASVAGQGGLSFAIAAAGAAFGHAAKRGQATFSPSGSDLPDRVRNGEKVACPLFAGLANIG